MEVDVVNTIVYDSKASNNENIFPKNWNSLYAFLYYYYDINFADEWEAELEKICVKEEKEFPNPKLLALIKS